MAENINMPSDDKRRLPRQRSRSRPPRDPSLAALGSTGKPLLFAMVVLLLIGYYTLVNRDPSGLRGVQGLINLRRPETSGVGAPETTGMEAAVSEQGLVPLEAHIMSKCPDAKVGIPSLWYCRSNQLTAGDLYREVIG
jgi:hypothetical protein